MSFEVKATDPFRRKVKKLTKKHASLKGDLADLIASLGEYPTQGTHLGGNCYKIRLAITAKGKGKSGGARIVTLVRIERKTVYLLDIYDKSYQSSISDKELKLLIKLLSE